MHSKEQTQMLGRYPIAKIVNHLKFRIDETETKKVYISLS